MLYWMGEGEGGGSAGLAASGGGLGGAKGEWRQGGFEGGT